MLTFSKAISNGKTAQEAAIQAQKDQLAEEERLTKEAENEKKKQEVLA